MSASNGKCKPTLSDVAQWVRDNVALFRQQSPTGWPGLLADEVILRRGVPRSHALGLFAAIDECYLPGRGWQELLGVVSEGPPLDPSVYKPDPPKQRDP